MSILDDVLDKAPETAPLHPRLRDWGERIRRSGEKPQLEVFRPAPNLGLAQTEMSLHFSENGTPLPLETLLWDDELNAGLIQLGVQGIDRTNESERFALGLRAALRPAEREFGDGYFNAVLFEFVTESDLTRYPDIAEIVKYAFAVRPQQQGKNYNLCREMIADAILGRRYELEKLLGYRAEDARQILVKALARYLDERFSVSNRRRLNLL